jgi:rhodanese-related sulfurtransferase
MRQLIRMVILFAGGAALGLATNGVRPHGIALGHPVRSVAEGGACNAATGGNVISLVAAASLRGDPAVAFGDTRPAEEYARGHIAQAWHLPCFGGAQASAPQLTRLTGTRTLVVYGADEGQAEARLAAEELLRRGFADVRVLAGGFQAWQAAGLPAESGPCDECRKP